MMKTYLKRAFQLSDSGVKGLAKSIWSFFLYYVSFVPPMICVFLFADRLLNGNTGKPVVYLLFMLAATLVMYLVINYTRFHPNRFHLFCGIPRFYPDALQPFPPKTLFRYP